MEHRLKQAVARAAARAEFMPPHRLVRHRDAHRALHRNSINRVLAVTITRAVGSMWCAYAFTALALVALPAALASHSILVIVGWFAQTFLQLVLLSIIIVGQNVQAEATDQRAETDHVTLELLREINKAQLTILQHLETVASKEPS